MNETNCLYWAVANIPVVELYKPNSYIITAEGYREEEGYKVKCLIHSAIRLSSSHVYNDSSSINYLDFEGGYYDSPLERWISCWKQERVQEQCLYWDYSIYTYTLRDSKTKKFWKRMISLGSPYNDAILQKERLTIFENVYNYNE